LIINDIVEVLYGPVKAFKRIIEKPQYLGAIIIILLFVVAMVGYESAEFSKVYAENTSPQIGVLSSFTNATFWNSAPGVNVSNNYADYFNYSVYVVGLSYPPNDSRGYYNLFANYTKDIGPSSLEINASNTNTATEALNIASALNSVNSSVPYVNCGASSGFENLSITMKQVSPAVAPLSATLTLYSINDTSFFKYDLTSSISNESINAWNNLTIPVGPNANGWSSSGTPAWGNITSLKLDFSYPTSSNISVRIGALFFRGQYVNALQSGGTDILIRFVEAFPLQFLFTWLFLTGAIYLFFKGLKAGIVWKPVFVAVSFALFVMVIRGVVNLLAVVAMPNVYFPFDVSLGGATNILGAISYPTDAIGHLTVMSQTAATTINSSTALLGNITFGMFAISYIWLGALCTIIVGTLKPEFTLTKRILISAVSVGVTLLLLLLLVNII